MKGYIKLHREWLDHWLYKENRPNTRREAWEDMLLLVNHASKVVKIGDTEFDCSRGQSVLSLKSWADQFKWTKSRVCRFFKKLKKLHMIEIENLGKTTRITICDYSKYQDYKNGEEILNKKNQLGKSSDLETFKTEKENSTDQIYQKKIKDNNGNRYYREI